LDRNAREGGHAAKKGGRNRRGEIRQNVLQNVRFEDVQINALKNAQMPANKINKNVIDI